MQLIPPRCHITEQSLLGACLIAGCAPPCDPADFFDLDNRVIATAMLDIERRGGTPDLVQVVELVTKTGEILPSDVAELLNTMASDDHLEAYAAMVRDYAAARRMQARAHQFVAEMNDSDARDYKRVIAEFSTDILRLQDTSRIGREVSMKECIKSCLEDIERRMSTGNAMVGIPTGIYDLDQLTCGMGEQELWIIGARPSIGKTAMALNIMMQAVKWGADPVLFFSLDMGTQGILHRLFAAEARVNLRDIRSGQMNAMEYTRMTQHAASIYNLPVIITDDPATELDITRKSRKLKPSLIIVDFLTKIRPSKSAGSRYADYSNISGTMKNIAKELQCPLLLLVQLNRGSENENRPPILSDMRETGAIEEDADVVLLLHAEKNNRLAKTRKVFLAKNRQGEVGIWDMAWLGEYQRFERLDRSNP